MQRMKEDYNSSKWFRGDRMLAAPSLSRTYLSEQLALNFTGDQRNRWLQLSTSDRSPSVVPPDPDPERPPSLEERRERLVDNRASYFRIKSCPPDYVLNSRYYKTIIQRNRTFARSMKSIKVSPDKTPNGESYRSFVLGARYADIRCHPGPVKRYDLLIPRKEDPDATARPPPPPPPRGPKLNAGATPTPPRLNALHSSTAQFRKPYSTGSDRREEGRRSSPLIAVYGSTPQSPRRNPATPVRSPDSRSPRRIPRLCRSTEGSQVFGRSSPASPELRSSRSSPQPGIKVALKNVETSPVDLKQDLFGASEESREIMPMVEVVPGSAEGDFISPEAQKLTGEILKQSQVEDTAGASSEAVEEEAAWMNGTQGDSANLEDQGFVHGGQAEAQDDKQQVDSDPTTDNATESQATATEAIVILDKPMADVAPEDMNMASRSSTIFVDMSSLTLQQVDSNT